MLDVAIVGGGPAGLSTALHLPPQTRSVVLEKERYPREKICAGGVGARAFRLLAKIGVEVDCPRVALHALALRFGDHPESVLRHDGMGFVVRRVEFDHALAKVAVSRGVDVRDNCGVDDVELLPDRVRLHTTQGVIEARALVGADGVAGIVRRKTGFPRGELRAQVCELDTPTTTHDQPRDTIVFDFATRDLRGYAWDFPTLVNHQPLVCRGIYAIGHDHPKTRMARYLAARGLALADYKLKQFAERGWVPGEPIARPRVLLVGEAAGIDIATGEGIAQAIEYGSVAAPYLAAALARDDLGFTDWQRTVARHHLGRQLRIRHACYRAFYGGRRDLLERLMPRMPALMHVGVLDFAGDPIKTRNLLRGGAQFLRALV